MVLCGSCIKADVCQYTDDDKSKECFSYVNDSRRRNYKVTGTYCTEVLAVDVNDAKERVYNGLELTDFIWEATEV